MEKLDLLPSECGGCICKVKLLKFFIKNKLLSICLLLGTKQDLWNTVPPKMAQRVFAGMLNETLTILTVRYTQVI